MTRILVADGDPASRDRLRRLCDRHAGWRVCAEAGNGAEAVEMAARLSPELAIIDLALPGTNGLEAVRRIKQLRPKTEILVITSHVTEDLIRDLLIGGARSCLDKDEASHCLVAALSALAQHRPYMAPVMAHAVLDGFLGQRASDSGGKRPSLLLTARERQILQLLAEGHSNSGIAERLGISVKTVVGRRSAMMRKLGVGSLAELVRYAIRNRVIEDI